MLAIAVHIHADLNDPHEVHQVRRCLPNPVGEKDDVPWLGRAETLVGRDHAVVLEDIELALAAGECISGMAKRGRSVTNGIGIGAKRSRALEDAATSSSR